MSAIYEIRLSGFDPKEDARDGATSWTVYHSTDKTDHKEIINECIADHPFDKDCVWWNPKLSKVVKRLK